MAITHIGEGVEVAAIFSPDIKPVKFRWKTKIHPVEEVTYSWSSTLGLTRLLHFSVTSGSSLFELSYNISDMRWTLERVEPCP